MTDREKIAIKELEIARIHHGEDVRWREELEAVNKLSSYYHNLIFTDIMRQQKQIRRAIAIIRYERRNNVQGAQDS